LKLFNRSRKCNKDRMRGFAAKAFFKLPLPFIERGETVSRSRACIIAFICVIIGDPGKGIDAVYMRSLRSRHEKRTDRKILVVRTREAFTVCEGLDHPGRAGQ